MSTYIYLMAFSGFFSVIILAKNFLRFKNLEYKEMDFSNHVSFFSEIEKYIGAYLKNFWANKFIPAMFKEIEKLAHQFRIYMMKVENKLFKFNNYVKGKRILKENSVPSEYVRKLKS